MAKYRVVSGAIGRFEGEDYNHPKRYERGQIIELTALEAERLGPKVELVTEAAPPPEKKEEPPKK